MPVITTDFFGQFNAVSVIYICIMYCIFHPKMGSRAGLVVRASDSGARGRGSILTRFTVLCPWARHIYLPKVLVIPRKRWLRPNMTEKLFTGTLRIKSSSQITPKCKNNQLGSSENTHTYTQFQCGHNWSFDQDATYILRELFRPS